MDLNELEEKAGKVFMGVNKKFEGIEQKIFENTGVKVPIGTIIIVILFILMLLFFAKLILGMVGHFLFVDSANIEVLCAYGKSFRVKKDSDLIKFDKDKAKIDLIYERVDREGKIEVEIEGKKSFSSNGIKLNRISDVVGKINVVIFTPDDINIVKEGPKERRRFIDMMISSLKPNYLHLLSSYNQALEQRNNYLRQIKQENKDTSMLDIWDDQLSNYSSEIYRYRKLYIEKISEKLNSYYEMITNNKEEKVKIKYISTGKDKQTYSDNLAKTRDIDIKRGFTSTGIHRDDFILYINDRPAQVYGSQGQKRTLLLALKLCELSIVKEDINESPILLLDDFMSELDETRRNNFLENIKECQIIITCTDKIKLDADYSEYYVEKGVCRKL